MTRKQEEIQEKFKNEITELKSRAGDPEGAHCEADKLLLEALRELGFGELADAFEETRETVVFHYA